METESLETCETWNVETYCKISKLCKEIGLGHGGNPYVSGEIQVCDLLNKQGIKYFTTNKGANMAKLFNLYRRILNVSNPGG